MPSFSLSLRTDSPNKKGEYAIRLIITIGRKPQKSDTGYRILPEQWDKENQRVNKTHKNHAAINKALQTKLDDAQAIYASLDTGFIQPEGKKVVNSLKGNGSFYDCALEIINQMDDKEITIGAKKSKLNQINELYPGLRLKDITEEWAESYRKHLQLKKFAHNTIVGKMKFLALILKALAKKGFITSNPLADLKKGSYRPANRPILTKEEIKRIYNYVPPGGDKWLLIAKLASMLSYYSNGARHRDVLMCSEKNIYTEGNYKRIRWTPSKTSENEKVIDVKITPKLDKLIKKCLEVRERKDTILGVLNPTLSEKPLNKKISSCQAHINGYLKEIATSCGIDKKIKMTDFRKAYLRHITDQEGNIDIAQDAAGHFSSSITKGYVGKNQVNLDRANEELFGS